MHILFKVATRQRPQRFFKTLDNIIDLCESEDYNILVSIDEDDETMANDDVLKAIYNDRKYYKVQVAIGNSKSKIEAINANIKDVRFKWDILVNVSDDQRFIVEGFDNIIREAFGWDTDSVPTDFDKFVHFKEKYTEDKLCVLSIMGRVYYSRTNYVYHPAYKSLFCDDEATQVANILGKHVYIDKEIFVHEHAAWGLAEKDDLLKRNEKFWNIDKATFNKRKRKNFDL